MGVPRGLIVLITTSGVVVAALALLLTGSWWALGVVMLIHLLAFLVVMAYTLRRVNEGHD